MGGLRPWHIIVIVGVLVLLFGAKRLPDAARSLGRSLRIMKAETKGLIDDDNDLAEKAEPQYGRSPLNGEVQQPGYPQQGHQQAPAPGYQQVPSPGYQQAPAPGYQPAPGQGYQQAPPPGYQPAPQGYQPAPGPGYQQAPPPGHHQVAPDAVPPYQQPVPPYQQPVPPFTDPVQRTNDR